MEYLPFIFTSLVSLFGGGLLVKLLTVRQDRRKIEADINTAEAKIIVDYTEVHDRLRKTLIDELDRKDSNCNDRIDKLKLDYESELKRQEELHAEEIAILHDKIDNLVARVTQLELENERLKA